MHKVCLTNKTVLRIVKANESPVGGRLEGVFWWSLLVENFKKPTGKNQPERALGFRVVLRILPVILLGSAIGCIVLPRQLVQIQHVVRTL